jgi:DNA-binding response OmpR family regulator
MAAPILVIEDDAGIRDMLVDCLSDAGYTTATAANGSGALDLLRDGLVRPPLILLDLAMPLMSGQEFLKLWRESGGSAPVLVLTADQREQDQAEALGVDRVLTKPLDIATLLAAVDELVSGE